MLHNGMTLVPKIRSVPLSPSGVAKDSAQGFWVVFQIPETQMERAELPNLFIINS